MKAIDYIEAMKDIGANIKDKENYRLSVKSRNGKTMIHVEMKYSITSMGEAWTSIYAIEKEFTALEYFIRALNRNDLYN